MQIISDLHLHSKYSRAVSQQMEIPTMFQWEIKKGIGLLATGDWTHPLWLRELKNNLDEDGSGILKLKSEIKKNLILPKDYQEPKFLLSTEISLIYTAGGKGRRVHLLIFAPDFATVDKINAEILKRRGNLGSDGRPILPFSTPEFAEIIFNINPKCLIIPAHIWTPWFAVFGSMSGFDSLKECFGDQEKYIYAIETGLSSDPVMNWRIPELDSRAILSFSDAHSPAKLGREATAFNLKELTFGALREAIKKPDKENNVAYTIEFYPEEGKYHFTGHRLCNITQSPEETREKGTICPVCHKPLTVGVMHRVEKLAGRSEKELELENWGKNVKGIKSKKFARPPFVKIVPLTEIIAETIGSPVASHRVEPIYEKLVNSLSGEFNVLLKAETAEIAKNSSKEIAESVLKVRRGNLTVIPGFDGQFGVVKIGHHRDTEETETQKNISLPSPKQPEQIGLF